MKITDEMIKHAEFAAGQCFTDWTNRPNRDAYVGELTRRVAIAAAEAVAPLIATQVLREAAGPDPACGCPATVCPLVRHTDECSQRQRDERHAEILAAFDDDAPQSSEDR